MNLTVLMIAAYLPLVPVLYLVVKSGAFGKGSIGTLLKLFFLGVAAAVPAFLMEAGTLLLAAVLLRILQSGENSGAFLLLSCILRYVFAVALIEEGWKFFVLHTLTWKQMTMEKIGDGTAAAALAGAGFSAVMFAAWQAAWHVVPADMVTIRQAMPDFLHAGAVISFLFALLYVPSHFGFSGFMGSLYGVAKGSEQKNHGTRAGLMLIVSFVMPVLIHSVCMVMIGFGIAAEAVLWTILGLVAEGLLASAMAMSLSGLKKEESLDGEEEDGAVDFADSEEFAEFAEAAGNESALSSEAADGEGAFLPEAASVGEEGATAPEAAGDEDAPSPDAISPETGEDGTSIPEAAGDGAVPSPDAFSQEKEEETAFTEGAAEAALAEGPAGTASTEGTDYDPEDPSISMAGSVGDLTEPVSLLTGSASEETDPFAPGEDLT